MIFTKFFAPTLANSGIMRTVTAFFVATMLLPVSGNMKSYAQSSISGKTGLPVPRFVSLKAEKVNMRIGPGKQFKVVWLYVKKGLPMEIIQEYDNWRKVRDPVGQEGWILHSLLSGKRTVIVNPGETGRESGAVDMRDGDDPASPPIARVEPGVVMNVIACQIQQCRLSADGTTGFLDKKFLWGVYPKELIEE